MTNGALEGTIILGTIKKNSFCAVSSVELIKKKKLVKIYLKNS